MVSVVRAITMPAVHEQVQERAQEQQDIWQESEEMRGVFGDQEESRNG
jgi:hypothetical protein